MPFPSIVIVSPAAPGTNNGNARTADRWAGMLAARAQARVVERWPQDESSGADLMLALHARRSAASIQAWHDRHGSRGLCVVLTGTDLYPDITKDPAALRSIHLASRLVVLQERGPDALPPDQRVKARVIFQSTSAMTPLPKPADHLRAVMVGHMRDVKSPGTLMEAARLLAARKDIVIDHVGEAMEPVWAETARATEVAAPGYHWLGPRPYDETRERIRAAHVLVHTSAAEGGAHVIMEAVRSGTPVIASRVPGNVGMLGEDYVGYFDAGDASALAGLLTACREGQSAPDTGMLSRLRAQCERRAALFSPEAEQAALTRLIQELQDFA